MQLRALGVEQSARAFATPGGRVDNTHHNNFGSYQLAHCIVQAIRDQKLPLAKFIRDDFHGFDPAKPDDPDKFADPASAEFTNQRPLGDEGNRKSTLITANEPQKNTDGQMWNSGNQEKSTKRRRFFPRSSSIPEFLISPLVRWSFSEDSKSKSVD